MSDFRLPLDGQLPKLMRYATALTRDVEEATDLVEDTIREALARAPEQRRETELRVWLLTILHEQRDNPFRLANPAAGPRKPVADPAAGATLSRFDRALGRLPEEQRAVILLIGLEGMSYDNAAAILGISAGATRSRLVRGRESLARSMASAPIRRGQSRAAA